MNGRLSLRTLFVSTILPLLSLLSVCYTSIYVFYPAQTVFHPQPPPVVFSGLNDLYVCADLLRYGRPSLTFSDFESLPSGWGRLGGSWSIVGGYKGNGLLGIDDNAGPGGSSLYYWGSSISSYDRFNVSVKVRWYLGTRMWMGVSLLQLLTTSSRFYEISVYVFGNSGYLQIWYYDGRAWTRLYASTAFSPVDRWLILYINYIRSAAGSTNYISATVYSVDGSVLASGSATASGGAYFIPSYVSVSVDDGRAVFDDFVISISDPRYVYVMEAPQGFILSLYDDLGNKVAEATSPGGTTRLNVLSDVVVGRGLGGVFRVYDVSGNLCLAKSFIDPIVGSDIYVLVVHRVTIAFHDEHTRAEIRVLLSGYHLRLPRTVVLSAVPVDVNPYYAGIVLHPGHSQIQPDLRLLIEVSNGTSSDSILISGGSPPPGPVETDLLKIGSGTDLEVSIEVSKESTNFSRLYLELVYCADPQLKSVCVYYPVTLEV